MTLDVSENSLHRNSLTELVNYLRSTKVLQKLSLEKMTITDSLLRSMSAKLLIEQEKLRLMTVQSLIMSRNQIGDSSMESFSEILKYLPLKELDLSWNEIKAVGATILFRVLAEASMNESFRSFQLESLDMSWNAMGTFSDTKRTVAQALSDLLSVNRTLTHLNISNNNLNAKDCAIIGEGLNNNHTLFGLHIAGNDGKLNSVGLLYPDEESSLIKSTERLAAAHQEVSLMKMIQGPTAMTRFHKHDIHWSIRNSCWICGGWQERRLSFTIQKNVLEILNPDLPINVYLYASFDNWSEYEVMRPSTLGKDRIVKAEAFVESDSSLYTLRQSSYYRQHVLTVADIKSPRKTLALQSLRNIERVGNNSPTSNVKTKKLRSPSMSPPIHPTFDNDENDNKDQQLIIRGLGDIAGPMFEIFRVIPPGTYVSLVCAFIFL